MVDSKLIYWDLVHTLNKIYDTEIMSPEIPMEITDDEGLLTADERADVLNLLNKTFEDNNINLEVAMYEDDGSFFDIMFWKRNSSKPIMEVKKNDK